MNDEELTLMTKNHKNQFSEEMDYEEDEKGKLLDKRTMRQDTETLLPDTEESGYLLLKRKVYTQVEFDDRYADQTLPLTAREIIKDTCQCSTKCVGRNALGFFPIAKFLRSYQWRQWILADLLSGLTVGFIHLPQGLGFGLLASLKPVNGLYTSFFPIVAYMIFGTSPHVSMGTNAVVSLLTANLVEREAQTHQSSLENTTLTDEQLLDYKVSIATAASFIVGLLLIGMGFLRMGFITNYLSKSFIGGFTFAAAVHIASSQISKLLHIKIPPKSGAGRLVMTYVDIFKNITQTNPGDIIIGMICIAILLGVKIGINERYRHKLKIPVPTELILVILSTVISHFAELHRRFNIAIVGNVPAGMPPLTVPPMNALPSVAAEAFVIAILCFAITIALAKLCAKQHSYDIDDNQELLAYGVCNLLGSFFGNFPSCTAPPRTMLLNSQGTKSTLNGLTSAIFILLVLLLIGKLFESLPIAMLAAMIIVAMKDLLLQVRNLPSLWQVNKPDFFIWMLTAFVSILADLDLGLLAGVGFSIFTVLVVSQIANGTLLGRSQFEDVIMSQNRKGIQEVQGVRIFRFEAQLHFASAERFKKQLFTLVFNPVKHARKRDLLVKEGGDEVLPLNDGKVESGINETVHHLILDCSSMTYVDVAGIDMLQVTAAQFALAGVVIFLAAIPPASLAKMERAEFFQKFDKGRVFYSVFDALSRASKDCTRDKL